MPQSPLPPTGAREAFDREALPHLNAVYRFARSLTGANAEAEDLAQETYLHAYRNWQQFQLGTNCRAWLFTICRNIRIREWRRAREEPTDTAELESLASAALHSGFTETDPSGGFLEAPELDDVLRTELAKLPEEYREVVVLADLEDQSYQTIARVLDVPIGTVKSRLFRGRRILQEALIEFARDAGLVPRGGGL